MRFTSTARGARLARRLVAIRLHEYGVPYGTDAHDDIVLITAELAANAVRHGHVPGRDFHVRLSLTAPPSRTARIEVSDTKGERMPPRPGEPRAGGRGLVLVSGLAAAWDWHLRKEGPGKTVWAEVGVGDGGGEPYGKTPTGGSTPH
ncbi:ATP-binding protein [Streptomyces sp. NPDC046860]|uniref:ATP-binding protein n=1 Tax=Streptomyces sp. NPDC046860 TaxID=3154495 RepID=UPI0033D584A8